MNWKVLARRTVTGSPGSGDWREYLCVRSNKNGYQLAICGFEVDANGDELSNLITDQNYSPVQIRAFNEEALRNALVNLGWRLEDLSNAFRNWPR
jgi:hypothetical protein